MENLRIIVTGKVKETETDGHCQQENSRQSAVNYQRQSTGPWIALMATAKHSSDLLICPRLKREILDLK